MSMWPYLLIAGPRHLVQLQVTGAPHLAPQHLLEGWQLGHLDSASARLAKEPSNVLSTQYMLPVAGPLNTWR